MGSSKRHRRRLHKQRRRPNNPTGPQESSHRGGAGPLTARDEVLAAAEAFWCLGEQAYESQLEGLARHGQGSLEQAIRWWVDRGLDRAWDCGWQPADVVRVVRRHLTPAHAEMLAPAVTESAGRRPEAATDDRWAAQVSALRRDSKQGREPLFGSKPAPSVEVVSVLLHLPPLPRLTTTSRGKPRETGGRSGAMLERVRALLAKAESTTFPEEAEALTAKAQELMARHSIDEAMLEAGPGASTSEVVGWRIGIDDPYADAKSILLDRIADANSCRAVWNKGLGFSTVFGLRGDLEMVELLFTSLLVQGTEAMLRAGRSSDYSGRSRTRSFRRSFLLAYAGRIGERLATTTARVVAEETERHGEALLPVLASRAEAVEEAVRNVYPHLAEQGVSISNYDGWVAGRAAADLASLSVGEELAAG